MLSAVVHRASTEKCNVCVRPSVQMVTTVRCTYHDTPACH